MSGNGAEAKKRAEQLKQDLGVDLYARYPLRVIERRMDRPPESAADRKAWRPIEDEETRVYHCRLRYSWCFPICYKYAVLIRNGEIVSGPDSQPVPQTQEVVAAILGMRQPNVARAELRLEQRKLLQREGHRVYPQPKPPDLTPEERLKYISTDIFRDSDELILPADFLNLLNNLALSDDIRTDIRAEGIKICRTFNDKLSNLRADKRQSFEDLCTRAKSLCTTNGGASTAGYEPCTDAPIYKDRARASDLDVDKDSSSSTSVPPVNQTQIAQAIREETGETPDGQLVRDLVRNCRDRCPDATTDEITLAVKAKCGQARSSTKRIENMHGWLLTVVPKQFIDFDRNAAPSGAPSGKPRTLAEFIAAKKAGAAL
jgi:hypothetical protein